MKNNINEIEVNTLYDLKLDKAYELVKKETSYLDKIDKKEVKQIMFSYYRDIIILLNNGIVLLNGIKKLEDIQLIHFLNAVQILAISNKKEIYSVIDDEDITNYINNNNCQYKKIIIDVVSIIALTQDGIIKTITPPDQIAIDYTKFYNVDDLGYVENNEDIVIIKNNKVYSLFYNYNYIKNKPNILLEGKSNNIIIID